MRSPNALIAALRAIRANPARPLPNRPPHRRHDGE
jgi:hypothetical protein